MSTTISKDTPVSLFIDCVYPNLEEMAITATILFLASDPEVTKDPAQMHLYKMAHETVLELFARSCALRDAAYNLGTQGGEEGALTLSNAREIIERRVAESIHSREAMATMDGSEKAN